ncbi:MAG: hypothetical protein ACO4CS_17835 [bacterium]
MAREIDGKLRVANDQWGDFQFSISTGKILGLSTREVYGYNPDINGAYEPIWQTGGAFPYPTSEQTINIVSTSALDEAANAGVREVTIEYLDGDFNTQIVDVELDGTNAVQVATDFFRIQDVRSKKVGANGDAEGAISVSYGANTVATIIAGGNEAKNSFYTVPAGYTAYIVGASISASKGGDLAFLLEYRNAAVPNSPFISGNQVDIFEEGIYFDLPTYYVVPEKYDIRIRAKSGQGSNIQAAVTYHMILRNNELYANN